MEEQFEYDAAFVDEPEQNGISQEEGFKKIKDQLARAEEDRDRAIRDAQLQAQRASEIETRFNTSEQAYLKIEKERAENDLKIQQLALRNATEAGDSELASKLTLAMVETQSRVNRLGENISRAPQPQMQPTQSIQGQPTYDDLLSSSELSSQQRQFLRDRPELKDSENLRIMFDQIGKENTSGEYTNWSQKWIDSLDKRLEKNGVYKGIESAKNDREGSRMNRSDDDGYGGRSGSPHDNAPASMARGESRGQSGSPRNGNGTVRLTAEERQMADTVSNWGDGLYSKGKAYLEYAKRNGKYEVESDGRINIQMSGVRDFQRTYSNRGR